MFVIQPTVEITRELMPRLKATRRHDGLYLPFWGHICCINVTLQPSLPRMLVKNTSRAVTPHSISRRSRAIRVRLASILSLTDGDVVRLLYYLHPFPWRFLTAENTHHLHRHALHSWQPSGHNLHLLSPSSSSRINKRVMICLQVNPLTSFAKKDPQDHTGSHSYRSSRLSSTEPPPQSDSSHKRSSKEVLADYVANLLYAICEYVL
jgi:hypothetical protein